MYDIVLFDLDGTLTNPKEGITKCVQYALQKFGIDEEQDKLTCFIGPPLPEAFMEFYGFDETAAHLATERFRERFSSVGIFENYPYEGIGDLLGRLCEAGSKLAVATSKPEVFAVRILERYRLSSYFSQIVGSELDGRRVHKQDVIAEAFKRMGLSLPLAPGISAIMVGDRKQDVIGASACKIPCLGVGYGFAQEGELESAGACAVVRSLAEMESYLLVEN